MGGTTVDVNFKRKSMDEYICKLRFFADHLKKEGKEYASDFLDKLVASENKTLELLEFIYKTVDDLSENVIKIFTFLLEQNAELEWFALTSFIEDETGEVSVYYPYIHRAIEQNIDVKFVQEKIYENCDVQELEKYLNDMQESNMPKECLSSDDSEFETQMEENRKLHLQIMTMTNELDAAHTELFTERSNWDKCNKELEHVQGQLKKSNMKTSVLERKLSQMEDANTQLVNVNDYLENEKKELEITIVQLQTDNETLEKQLIVLQGAVDEKAVRIRELEEIIRNMEEQNFAPSWHEEDSGLVHEETTVLEDVEETYDFDANPIFDMPSDTMFTNDIDEYKIGTDIFKNAIEIKDNSKVMVKHTNIFVKIFAYYQKEKFMKKPEQEQQNLLFIEMMKKNYSMELVDLVKKALVSNAASKTDLYTLICQNASKDEIVRLCNMPT